MRFFKRLHMFSLSFSLILALILAGFAYASRAAASPLVYLLGPKSEPCTAGGAPVPTGPQGMPFGIGLRNFYADEAVYISFTFPDGRVFSPIPASLSPADTPEGLDGRADTPPNPPYAVVANPGGDYYALLPTNDKWPLGCYKVTALGVESGNQATGTYQVVGGSPLLPASAAMLEVQSKAGKASSGPQGSTVEVFGRGFLSEEAITLRLVQPNGTILSLDGATTSVIGSFQTSFELGDGYAAGEYRVVASGADQGVSQSFTLTATALAPSGFGRLRIARPSGAPSVVKQGASFELQGQQFFAGEPLAITARRPDGSVRPLAVAGANELGEFAAELTLDNLMPTGAYTLVVAGELSGYRSTLELRLEAGSPNVTDVTLAPPAANPADAPTAQPTADGSTGGGEFGKGIDPTATAAPSKSGSGATGSGALLAGGFDAEQAVVAVPTAVPPPAW